MLRTTHRPTVDRLDVDEAHLAEAIQVEAHGVGVDPERFGEVVGRQRGRRAGQLFVHRVPGLVTQGLEDRQLLRRFALVHGLDGTRPRAYFQDVACVNQYDVHT